MFSRAIAAISWKGTLADGTLVNLIVSDDDKNGGLVLAKDGTEQPKKWLGAMTTAEDGTLIVYAEDKAGDRAAVAIMPQGSGEVKAWSGAATTDANGKETVTDEATGETFSYTWTENPEDGTVEINADTYGKGTLVKIIASEWMTLDEFAKLMAQK